MSELIAQNSQLPSAIEDLSRFVLVGREKLNAVRAEMRAIESLTLAKDVREQKLKEAQELSSALLDAETKIGNLTLQMDKHIGGDRKSEKIKRCSGVTFDNDGDEINLQSAMTFDEDAEPVTKTERIKELGFNKRQVSEFERMAKHPEIVESVKAEAVTNNKVATRDAVMSRIKTIEKEQKKEEKAERKEYTLDKTVPEGYCTLFCDDIRDGLEQIEDESIDFIITDPPYPKEYLELYSNLSTLAKRVLKPNGSLVVMTGQTYLPEVIQRLSESMKYHWCLAYTTPGGQSPQLFQKKVNSFWKPVLWFTKGEYNGDWIGDVLKSPVNDNDKRFHEWGQSLAGMRDIVERFTNPGNIILDPFLGGGTTGVAAVTMGRIFIGVDIEQKNIDISDARIKEVYSECLK